MGTSTTFPQMSCNLNLISLFSVYHFNFHRQIASNSLRENVTNTLLLILLYELDLNLIDLLEAYLLFRAERNVESVSQPLKRKKKGREKRNKTNTDTQEPFHTSSGSFLRHDIKILEGEHNIIFTLKYFLSKYNFYQ